MEVKVTSMVKDLKREPIRLKTWMNKPTVEKPTDARIYSEVRKGSGAVLHANVTAHVLRPLLTERVTVQLRDNGLGLLHLICVRRKLGPSVQKKLGKRWERGEGACRGVRKQKTKRAGWSVAVE